MVFKEGFLEEAALGLDPGGRIPFGGFVISEHSFFHGRVCHENLSRAPKEK